MKSLITAAFTTASVLFICPAQAHHGQEFFLLYDAQVQKPLHGILQGNFSFIDEGGDDSMDLSPSLSMGILPRTAFNLRADFTDESGDGWAYRSIEPGFQFDLTPVQLKIPVRFGLAVSYQFSGGGESGGSSHGHGTSDLSGASVAHVHNGSATHSAGHGHSSVGSAPHDHSSHYHPPTPVTLPGPGGTGPGADLGPDALTPEELAAMEAENAAAAQQAAANGAAAAAQQVSAAKKAAAAAAKKNRQMADGNRQTKDDHHNGDSGHSHSGGIHNHDDNLFTARLIFEADLTPNTLLVGNLINVLPEGGSAAWGYAVGVRHRFHPRFAMGVEALGDFDARGHQEVLGAVFFEPMHHMLLKVGVGTGLTSVSPDATLRAGVLWMF